MKINHICIIFLSIIYVSQLLACPTCIADWRDPQDEQEEKVS